MGDIHLNICFSEVESVSTVETSAVMICHVTNLTYLNYIKNLIFFVEMSAERILEPTERRK